MNARRTNVADSQGGAAVVSNKIFETISDRRSHGWRTAKNDNVLEKRAEINLLQPLDRIGTQHKSGDRDS